MIFTPQIWKERTAQKMRALSEWLKRRRDQDLPYVAYGALSTMTLLPVVEVAARGLAQTGNAFTYLGPFFGVASAASAVGAGLLTNQIQRWADRAGTETEADIERWVDEQLPQNADLRATLDAILQAVEVIPAAQQTLAAADQAWFDRRLADELHKLGSHIEYHAAAGDYGVIVQGVGHTVQVHHHNADPAAAARTELKKAYLERFSTYCNVLPLGALGADRTTEDDVTLDAVYIDLNTTTRIPLTDAEKKKLKDRDQTDRILPAMEAAERHKKLALVGDPGSGKSTFVRQLAGSVARRADAPLLPLFVILRDLSAPLAALELDNLDAETAQTKLVSVVCRQWRKDFADRHRLGTLAEHLDSLLAHEKLLLIFDGLDEVPQATRRRVNRAVRAVLKTYPNIAQAIVTCRVRSYTGDAVLPGFARHQLAPFNEDQIKKFVK
ncbi:MAG: NACHT domain-containing protein, partial [Chloroflexi bacterium]